MRASLRRFGVAVAAAIVLTIPLTRDVSLLRAEPVASGAEGAYPLNHTFDADPQPIGTPPANSGFEAAAFPVGTPPANYYQPATGRFLSATTSSLMLTGRPTPLLVW